MIAVAGEAGAANTGPLDEPLHAQDLFCGIFSVGPPTGAGPELGASENGKLPSIAFASFGSSQITIPARITPAINHRESTLPPLRRTTRQVSQVFTIVIR